MEGSEGDAAGPVSVPERSEGRAEPSEGIWGVWGSFGAVLDLLGGFGVFFCGVWRGFRGSLGGPGGVFGGDAAGPGSHLSSGRGGESPARGFGDFLGVVWSFWEGFGVVLVFFGGGFGMVWGDF